MHPYFMDMTNTRWVSARRYVDQCSALSKGGRVIYGEGIRPRSNAGWRLRLTRPTGPVPFQAGQAQRRPALLLSGDHYYPDIIHVG